MEAPSNAVARAGFWLVGRQARASNDDPGPLGELWGSLYAQPFMGLVKGRFSDDVYSVYCEYEGDHTKPYTVFLGYRVGEDAKPPGGLLRRYVPPGRFMIHVADGPAPASVIAVWQRVWASDLDRTYGADYEVHGAQEGSPIRVHVGVR